MKVLTVNTSDILGGAARAAYRLHRALGKAGVDSLMLVQKKKSDDFTVFSTANNKFQMGLNLLRPMIDHMPVKFYKNRTGTFFSPSVIGGKNILKIIDEIDPDVVHLHWICGGMIKIQYIAKINKPIVWSLHDMWAFTGGCHYDEGCKRYENSCGRCKVLGSRMVNDLSRKIFNRKQKTFAQKKDITIVGLSRWLNECSKNSTLLKSKNHKNLPNPIDTYIFKPVDKEKAREFWNLPKDKKLVLFGAMDATSDPRKGFKELREAFGKLEMEDVEFVVFGGVESENPPEFEFKTNYMGRIYDDISLATLYNACDVMIAPSLQENLSNVIMESLSCSIPVVAFDVGGNSDMIVHKKNGYLAKPFDTKDLKDGIEWILNLDANRYSELSNNARKKVLEEFDSRVVAKKYVELYEKVLKER